jgi:glutathione-regulated potassium-efflux system protein KefB
MSVGMLIDLDFVGKNLALVLGATLGLVLVKFLICIFIGLSERAPATSYLRAASLLTPAGEFSFVILPLAVTLGILSGQDQKLFMAVAAFSMLLGPLVSKAVDLFITRLEQKHKLAGPAVVEDFEGAGGRALVIGFGRFGQIVNQILLTSGTDVTVIDNDMEMIEAAGGFGFKVYYGDGQRLDVLRAAGATQAEAICVCIDDKEAALLMTEIIKTHFPQAKLLVRAYDRRHAIELMRHEPDIVMREVFESALLFGRETMHALGHSNFESAEVCDDVRIRDTERLKLQIEGDIKSGASLTRKKPVSSTVRPAPLNEPSKPSKGLSPETQALLDQAKASK